MNDKERILQLRDLLHGYNRDYYINNRPVVSDMEFDMLMRELQDLGAGHSTHIMKPKLPTGMRASGRDLAARTLKFAAK